LYAGQGLFLGKKTKMRPGGGKKISRPLPGKGKLLRGKYRKINFSFQELSQKLNNVKNQKGVK